MNKLSVSTVCLGVCVALALAGPASAQGKVISVPAGGDLQAAIDSALPGDTIELQPGGTYKGNFVLRANTGTSFITIRTAADARQPAAGVRVQPAHAPALARIVSTTSMPALRTQGPAHHYRLMLIEFGANSQGAGEIIQLGQADAQQVSLDQVPYALVLDRLYVHGDPLIGQKRGIALNSGSTDIVNCYISDMKAVGQDTQAIAAMNGPGPYLVENNYLEAAAENFLAGGVDPQIPNLTPSNITFRYNHLYKPTAWRSPIVATPTLVALTPGAGTLAAGTYAYRVVAERPVAGGATARSAASAEVSVTLAAPGAVTVSWAPVPDATSYRVYGRLPGSATEYWTTTSPSFVDDGTAGAAGSPGSGTVWTVKNIFELKNARHALVERNVMENNWKAAQPGYAIVFTPRNSGGTCTWCTIDDVTFRYNIVRHSAAGMNILGYDDGSPSDQAHNIRIVDNLFYDLNKTNWGGNGWAVLMGGGPADIVFDHNTIDHNGTSAFYAYGSPAMLGVQITNNLMRHGSYGIFGAGTSSYGTATINAYFPDGIVTNNVLAGGSASKYPAGNLFPTVTTHVAQFSAPTTGDYSLVSGSSYRLSGTDGRDLGADIEEIQNSAAVATRGTVSQVAPVAIGGTTLPRGTVDAPFSAALAATGGSGSYTWSIAGTLPAGLQFDRTTATFSGTPVEYGTWTVQVTAADAASSASTASATVVVCVWPRTVRISGASLPRETVGVGATGAIYADGGTGNYSFRLVSGTLPPGVSLDGASGTLSGSPTSIGSYTFGVEAADREYSDLCADQTFSITVAPPTLQITTTTLPDARRTIVYSTVLTAAGGTGTLTWRVIAGTLPSGFTLATNGTLSGKSGYTGYYTFTVEVRDSGSPAQSATRQYTLIVRTKTGWLP